MRRSAIAMHELTLSWVEAGEVRAQTIWENQPSKNPGTVRIGRDPTRCDIVLLHSTVSGLHVEIFYDRCKHHFYLRNLRRSNPARVDEQTLIDGEAVLNPGSTIYLGQIKLKVIAIDPRISAKALQGSLPSTGESTVAFPTSVRRRPPRKPLPTYGLQCPSCSKVSPSKLLDFGCPWCGSSLSSASSVLMSTQVE